MQVNSTGHSRSIRRVLRAARNEAGLTAQQVADRVAAALDRDKMSGQSILYYESFERHPPIDVFAAWARVLGFRLIVDLDRTDAERKPVMIRHPDVAEIARSLDEGPPEVRMAVATLLRQFGR